LDLKIIKRNDKKKLPIYKIMTRPSKEYLDYISKRLEAMNPGVNQINGPSCQDPFSMPSFMDQMGQTALHYLNNKKEVIIEPDPLFPNRN
jgi:hypothetical protein